MLKGIPSILSPALLKALCEMGHSDKLVITDGNFPAESMGKNATVIRLDGHGALEVLEAVLKVFPLDTYVKSPVKLMQKVAGDTVETPIWDEFKNTIKKYTDKEDVIEFVDRFDFYDIAKESYLIIYTSEKALYANVVLQKGVITD